MSVLRQHCDRPSFLAIALVFLVSEAAFAKGKVQAKPTEPVAASEPTPEPAASEPAPSSPDTSEPARADAPETAAAATASPPAASSAPGDSLAFIEGGFRYDLGTFSRRESVGANESVNNDEINSLSPMLTLGVLFPLSPGWRFGGAFGYGFNYEPQNNNDTLGQLLILDARLEWSTHANEVLSLFVMPKLGLTMLIPGGQLQERIDQNQLFGYDTWNVPRPGFLIGAEAGSRYALADWVHLRASLGYAWTMMFLLDSHASAGDISASQTWQTQASRLSGNLGIDVSF